MSILLVYRYLALSLFFMSALTASEYAIALTKIEAVAMSSGEVDARVAAINKVVNASVGTTDTVLEGF